MTFGFSGRVSHWILEGTKESVTPCLDSVENETELEGSELSIVSSELLLIWREILGDDEATLSYSIHQIYAKDLTRN